MEINWIGIIAATVSAFVLGGIWYGPIMGKSWMVAVGKTEEELKEAGIAYTVGKFPFTASGKASAARCR